MENLLLNTTGVHTLEELIKLKDFIEYCKNFDTDMMVDFKEKVESYIGNKMKNRYKSDDDLVKEIMASYINMCEDLKQNGKIINYSVENNQVSEENIIININITPTITMKHIKTNFTVTKDGYEFNNKKK